MFDDNQDMQPGEAGQRAEIRADLAALPYDRLVWVHHAITAILRLADMGIDNERVALFFGQHRHTITLALAEGASGEALARAIAADLAAVLPTSNPPPSGSETPAEGGHHDQ